MPNGEKNMGKSVFKVEIDNKALSDFGDHGPERFCCDDPDQVKYILERTFGTGTVNVIRIRQK